VQKVRDLGAQGVHVQKLRDFKWSEICRYEEIVYVQKLRELAVGMVSGVVYVQKLRGLGRSGDAQRGVTAVIVSNLSVIVPDVNREVKGKMQWQVTNRDRGRGARRGQEGVPR